MILASESFLQARLKACLGASSRATPSSRPASLRASIRSRWRTATPEQVQAMISPSSLVPEVMGQRPLAGLAVAVMGLSFRVVGNKHGPTEAAPMGPIDWAA